MWAFLGWISLAGLEYERRRGGTWRVARPGLNIVACLARSLPVEEEAPVGGTFYWQMKMLYTPVPPLPSLSVCSALGIDFSSVAASSSSDC